MSTQKGLVPINTKTYLNPLKDWNRIKSNLPQYKNILDKLNKNFKNTGFNNFRKLL